jgi:hypothetical protein
MNTHEELHKTMMEYRRGQFPPKRVPWDYRSFAAFPKHEQEKIRQQQQLTLQQCVSSSSGPATAGNHDGKSTVSTDKTQCL